MHDHQWVSGFSFGKHVLRECHCGMLLLPTGKLQFSKVREYYKKVAERVNSST